MASAFSVGGLVSGLDTNSLISGLTSIEQQKVTAVQKRQNQAQTTLSSLGDLQSKFMGFAALARSMNDVKDFDVYQATSSDATTVELQGGTEGLEGSFAVRVQQLASSWKVSSQKYSSATTDLNLAGTLTLSRASASVTADPSKPTVDISINHGDTLKDIASKINSADNAGVSATLITVASGDVRLMLTSVDPGSNTFTMSSSGGDDIASALGVMTSGTQTRTSDFSLRQAAGGAATSATKLSDLFTGIGANNIGSTDSITLTGTDSTGAAIAGGTKFPPDPPDPVSGPLKDATVGQLAAWMGAKLGATVTVDSSGRLSAKRSNGTAIDFSLAMTTGSTGTLQLGTSSDQRSFTNVIAEGRKAFYTLNGLSVASDTNTDETTLSGAKVVMKNVTAATDPDVQLTLKRDDTAIEKKVSDFLDSYNGLMSFIDDKSTATIKETTDSNGQKIKTFIAGDFTGQTSVQTLKQTLQQMMTSEVSNLTGKTVYTSFASVGITTSKDDGTLGLDTTKFQKAMNNDFEGVRRLFANSAWTSNSGATVGGWTQDTKSGSWTVNPSANTIGGVAADRNGDVISGNTGNMLGLGITAPSSLSPFQATFSRGVAGLVEQFYNSATTIGGILRDAKTSVANQVSDYGKQVDTTQARVDAYRQTLVSQFSGLEQTMLRLKSQSSSFMSQISSL